ncbi:DUF2213 domain-containing protein [Tatumella citrea]|uniref:DUF2213 domain-containing protein n=1 Tax=Tatumella citrea TaxID=53336 RepID=A0A1Y0LL63_TATCI|nr:DUF2213 domain-containing protein [Tatumella citrea]ARU94567.1 hypothetical protein A7K98_12825 [Tatumella citrea]ARU98605.1 hypothetical protein A7K99_12815 [Tatumella citrea]
MSRNCVNVLSVINSASNISTETINGRDHIIVRGITPVVDDIVMNRKLYPAAEISKGYKTLERNPMPLGHPKIDGKHISARDVQAVNQFHVGAWLQNVNHSGGKVTGDMYVDRRYAEGSEHGRRLLERLDDMAAGKNTEPVHISTGLMYSGIAANGESKGKKYNEIATNMDFDHVAVLLDEPGAGTPAEGVGIFVNSDGTEQEIEVVNLSDADIPDPNDPFKSFINQLKAFFSANSKQSDEGNDPMKELITNALKAKGIETEGKSDAELMDAYNKAMADDAAKKDETPEEKAARLKKEADDKAAADKATGTATNTEEVPAWAKSLTEKVESLTLQVNAGQESEKTTMRTAVKAKFGMTDIAVNALDGEPLKELYAQCATSHGLSGAFNHSTDTKSISEMPE